MIKKLKTVYSGEFLFAIFIVVGSLKEAFDIPYIDETAFLLVVTAAIAIKRFFENGLKFPKQLVSPVLIFTMIIGISLFSVVYTPSQTLVFDKLIRFALIAGWCFFGVFFLFRDENSIKRFLWGLLFVSFLMAFSFFKAGLSTNIGFTNTIASSYVTFARICSMGSLILITFFLFSKQQKLIRYSALLSSVLLFVPLIQSGARMPIVILGLTLLYIPVSMIRVTKGDVLISKKIIPLLLLMVLVLSSVSVLIQKGYAETFVYRMEVMMNNSGGGDSVLARTTRFSTAWEMSKDSYFLGKGLGSFPLYFDSMEVDDYPHNLYLEFLSELGIVALGLFVSLLAMAYLRAYRYYKQKGLNPLNASVYLIFLFWFINSFGSSSMTGDKVFYTIIAIMIMLPFLGNNQQVLNA